MRSDKLHRSAMPTDIMPSAQLLIPLAFSLLLFALAAALGLVLRLAFVVDLPGWIEYRNVQHAHSHIALLGWLFGALYLIITAVFPVQAKNYRRLYWMLQGAVVGMAITFPFGGYNPVSIIFTTIHILLSYVFAYRLWRELGYSKATGWAVSLLKASLVFMVISTIGTWSLGPILALDLKGSAWYYGAIQFYLHFQFNGWLIFSALAIFFRILEKNKVRVNDQLFSCFFIALMFATVFTFALAVTWSTPLPVIFGINSVGALVQLISLALLILVIRQALEKLPRLFSVLSARLLLIAALALVIKVFIQTAVVIPEVAEISYTIRNFAVGFIHLLMLGCLSLFLFVMISEVTRFPMHVAGLWMFVVGVLTTELLLFGQGVAFWLGLGFIPGYYLLLATFSGLIFLGVALNTVEFLKKTA